MTEKELLKVARRAINISRKVRDAHLAVAGLTCTDSENPFAKASKAVSAVNSAKNMLSRYGVHIPEVLASHNIEDVFCVIMDDPDNVRNICNKLVSSEQED